jgi:hypothetical protein
MCGIAQVLATPIVQADSAPAETIPNHPALTDRFVFDVGGFYSRSSTQAGLSGPAGGVGVIVDFESALGLEDQNLTPIGGFHWRMTDRWRLEVEYFQVNRKATHTLATDVEWGGVTFPIGSTTDTRYNFSDTRASVGYSFYKRRDKELGLGLGLHVANAKATVESEGLGTEAGSTTAPLPVLSFYGAFALTDTWAVRVRGDWLSLTYDVYSGSVRSSALDVVYQPFRHVGFGLGMRTLIVDLQVDDPKWRGQMRTTYSGPAAFVTASF